MFKNLVFIICAIVLFTGCIEVTRGYKSTVFMKVEGESKSTYTASPTLDVNADKEYSDAFKTNADASQNKTTTPASDDKPKTNEVK